MQVLKQIVIIYSNDFYLESLKRGFLSFIFWVLCSIFGFRPPNRYFLYLVSKFNLFENIAKVLRLSILKFIPSANKLSCSLRYFILGFMLQFWISSTILKFRSLIGIFWYSQNLIFFFKYSKSFGAIHTEIILQNTVEKSTPFQRTENRLSTKF